MLYISDTEFHELMNQIPVMASSAEDIITQYCDILDSIQEEEILEGETAQKLSQYSGLVRNILSGEVTRIMEQCKADAEAYHQAVVADDNASFI